MLNPTFILADNNYIPESSGLSISWAAWESIWTPLKRPLMEAFSQSRMITVTTIQNNVKV